MDGIKHKHVEHADLSEFQQAVCDYLREVRELLVAQSVPSGTGSGSIKAIGQADPAPGAEVLFIVPTGRRWRVLSMVFDFTTDATKAERQVHILVDDTVVNLFNSGSNVGQKKNQFYSYAVVPGGVLGVTSKAWPMASIPAPTNLVLSSGWRIRTATTGIKPGDEYSSPGLLVEEWTI